MARVLIATLLALHMILLSCTAYDHLNPYGIADRRYQVHEQEQVDTVQKKEKKSRKQKKNDKNKHQGIMKQELFQVTTPDTPETIITNQLKVGFYNQSCPRAEEIVTETMAEIFRTNPSAPANIIRLQFHDCFVGGCDASILLDSTPSGEDVEKSSVINYILLKGTDIIDDIKLRLEEECPQTVSCADTIAFAARDALELVGLPRVPQPSGRRDGLSSLSANVGQNVPSATWSVDQLIELFKRKGFTEEEMVILDGAHSVGGAHCIVFTKRLNNFADSGKPDPDLNPAFLNQLSGICLDPKEAIRNPLVNFDETPTKLDNLFYKKILEKKALLSTDQELLNDPRTSQFVRAMAEKPDEFAKRIPDLMLRMGAMEVVTGANGQIRKTCRSTLES